MTQFARVTLLLVLGLVAIGAAMRESRRQRAATERAERVEALARAADSFARAVESADASGLTVAPPQNPDVTVLYSNLPAPIRDSGRIAFTLEARSDGSYLHELLTARGGWNFRWPDRLGDPLRVWVEEPRHSAHDPAWTTDVRNAFLDWGDVGLPLGFTFTVDSARAEVHVTWVERFAERMTGRTLWRHDQHGWIVGGNIQLALFLPDGRRVTADGVRAIARHEVGHLLGLDHTADTTNVMSPQVYVSQLSEADRRTARLVYELPPGKLTP